MTELNEIVEYNKGREVIYACFSRIFINTLDDNAYKMLSDIMPFIETLKTDNKDDLLINDGVSALSKFIKEYNSLSAEHQEEFKNERIREYTRLFCLGNGVDLSESVYLSPSHLTQSEIESEVYHLYKKCNFEMDCKSNEPQDHLSYELMFMSFLSKNISKKYKEDNDMAVKLLEIQKEFLEKHILKWIDLLIKRTIKFKESYTFYLPALYFIDGFIKADYEYLKSLLDK